MSKIEASIVVPGAPRGKGRPRFVRATGRTYTDDKTAVYENLVKTIWLSEIGMRFCGEVSVEIDAVYQIPKSKPKKTQTAMAANELRPTVKPDADNVAKACLDGLIGVAFVDDTQVVDLIVRKHYGEPCVRVTVAGEIDDSELTQKTARGVVSSAAVENVRKMEYKGI